MGKDRYYCNKCKHYHYKGSDTYIKHLASANTGRKGHIANVSITKRNFEYIVHFIKNDRPFDKEIHISENMINEYTNFIIEQYFKHHYSH